MVEKKSKKFPKYIWLIIALVALVIIYIALLPLRATGANKYVQAGDSYLQEKKYLLADLEYRKALVLNPKNSEARSRLDLVAKAMSDPTILQDFYKECGNWREEEIVASAQDMPAKEKEAVLLSRSLIEAGEYQLAILPAKTATEMDPQYRDAWIYLGIANQRVAQMVQVNKEAREKYQSGADQAFAKAKAIDPEWEM